MSDSTRRAIGVRALACLSVGLGLALGAGGPAFGSTISGPLALVTVDGDSRFLTLPIVSGKGEAFLQVTIETSGGRVDLQVYMDPDPDIIYAVSIVDFGAPSVFGLTFIQPIVPLATPGTVSHTFSSSTTDNGGGDGVPVTALPPPLGISTDGAPDEIVVYSLSTNFGASWLNAGLDLAPSFVGPSGSGVQGPFNEGPVAGPAAGGSSYTDMRLDLSFSMAGNSDAFTFNGRALVIPEPAALALLGIGLVGLAALGRRRAPSGG